MLGASIVITCFLWYKLGASSEYRSGNSTIDLHAEVALDDEDVKDHKGPVEMGGDRVEEVGKKATVV
jgi:hypothetical protein